LRSKDEIVDRAIALMSVAGVGVGVPKLQIKRFVKEFAVAEKLTTDERAFMRKPTDRSRAQFSWRYEALHVLLWSLGFVSKLPRPTKQVDPSRLGKEILGRTEAKLRAQSRLRSTAEIRDEADLIYRYHWAVRDAELNGKPGPKGMNGDVVMVRHHALNWLVGDDDGDWDDVSTDT